MNESSFFKVGGRYRNRIGWYEDNNQEKWINDLIILKRVWDNIQNEESTLKPYKEEAENRLFFKTIGYLVKHSFIEAIIPQKSKDGLVSS